MTILKTLNVRPARLAFFLVIRTLISSETDVEGSVGIDANLGISAQLLPSAKVEANANLKAKLILGPISFHFRKASIEVIGESDPNVFWRYNIHSELFGTNMFRSFLILKVPKEAEFVRMQASLGVGTCKTPLESIW